MCFDVTVSTVSLKHIKHVKTDTLTRWSTCKGKSQGVRQENNTRTIEILYFLTRLWDCTCKERVLSLFDETVRFRRVQRAFYPEVILKLILSDELVIYLVCYINFYSMFVIINYIWAKLERCQILLFCDSFVLCVQLCVLCVNTILRHFHWRMSDTHRAKDTLITYWVVVQEYEYTEFIVGK